MKENATFHLYVRNKYSLALSLDCVIEEKADEAGGEE